MGMCIKKEGKLKTAISENEFTFSEVSLWCVLVSM